MKNHHSVPRKFPNLTVVKLQPDPTQSDEDPSFIELKVTTQMLNVLNAAKAWARQAARTKKTRAKGAPELVLGREMFREFKRAGGRFA